MNLSQVLNALLQNLAQSLKQGDDKVIYLFDDVQQWKAGVLGILLDYKLIKAISAAQSMECQGCENTCFMDVISHQVNDNQRSYIVCGDSEKQVLMGRITVKPEQLKQWQVSIKNLAELLAQLLGFEDVSLDAKTLKKELIPLGMFQSLNGRQWASLHKKPLALDLNQVQIPMSELLFVDNGKLTIDRTRINTVITVKQPIKAKDYQSNTDKRAQNKANTQSKYKSWQDEYEKLKRQNPNKPNMPKKTKGWYAYQISIMPIAQGGTVATITRNLKN
jgi:hypothetical protein